MKYLYANNNIYLLSYHFLKIYNNTKGNKYFHIVIVNYYRSHPDVGGMQINQAATDEEDTRHEIKIRHEPEAHEAHEAHEAEDERPSG